MRHRFFSIGLTGITSAFIADTDLLPVPSAAPLPFGALGGLAAVWARHKTR